MTRPLALPPMLNPIAYARHRRALIRAMAEDGISVAEIAAALDYTPASVRAIACREQIDLPKRRRGRKREVRT